MTVVLDDGWKHPIENLMPSEEKARQIREDSLRARLAGAVQREHLITSLGHHRIDWLNFQDIDRILTQNIKKEELDLLLDLLPTELVNSVEVVVVPEPLASLYFKDLLVVLANGRHSEALKSVTLVPLGHREDRCKVPLQAQVAGKKVLFLNGLHDTQLTLMQAFGNIKGRGAKLVAALVFVDSHSRVLDFPFPTYSMLRRPIRSVPKAECGICSQMQIPKKPEYDNSVQLDYQARRKAMLHSLRPDLY